MEVEFKDLIRKGITPIDALYTLLPENDIIRNYRKGVVRSDVINQLSIQDPEDVYIRYFQTYSGLSEVLQSHQLDYKFENLYFAYSSGLPRTEFPFLRERIPKTTEINFKYQVAKNLESLCDITNNNTYTLFGVVSYHQEENPRYYFEPQSDYFLLARNYKCYTYKEGMLTPAILDRYIRIAKRQNIDLLIFLGGNRSIIYDTRERYKNLYHRADRGILPETINSAILQLLQTNPNIYAVLSTIIQSMNPIFLREKLSRRQYHAIDNINRLIEEPDTTPEVVDSLRQLGVSEMIITHYLIYPSGRPRTTMPFMEKRQKTGVDNYRIITGDANPERSWLLSPELFGKHIFIKDNVLIPVVRYQMGMSRGLYNEEYSAEFCGTFYYFEPASDYYLECRNVFIAANKMTAYYNLAENKENAKNQILELIIKVRGFQGMSPLAIFNDMMMGNEQAFHHNPTLYGEEDIFDQSLCKLGNEAKLDVIILAAMTGKTRIVTEILDVRTRKTSFSKVSKKPPLILGTADEVNE